MDASDFIVPPPGLVPDAPKPPAETVRAARPVERALPSFAPGRTGPGAPAGPAVPAGPAAPVLPPAAAQGEAPDALEATGERVTWRLAGAGGVDAVVTARSVVGRAPNLADDATSSVALPLDDPARTVSKTHAVVEPAGEALLVSDLHSTNGVRIEHHGGSVELLAPGGSARVADGEVLVLGELRLLVARLPSPNV